MKSPPSGASIALAAVVALATLAPPVGAEILVGRWDIGLRVGTNLSNISNGPGTATNTANGLYAGALLGVGVSPMIELEAGAIYAEKGGEGEGLETNLEYVNFPLRVRLPLGGGAVMPYFFAGVEFGILLGAELTGGGDPVDVKELFEDFDFGTLAGLGIEFPVGKTFLLFEYSWARGLTDVVKGDEINGKNNTSQLVAGLKYRF